MAKCTNQIIRALRDTADNLEKSIDYQWGHMGSCNCGFLAQEITRLAKSEIHQRAMERHGDWSDQLNDYCPTSGYPMDELISQIIEFGFDRNDLKNLERLTDTRVLDRLPEQHRYLSHNKRDDVVRYLRTWADMIEEEMFIESISELVNRSSNELVPASGD